MTLQPGNTGNTQMVAHPHRRFNTTGTKVRGLTRCIARVEKQLVRSGGRKLRARLAERIERLREIRERLLARHDAMQTEAAA